MYTKRQGESDINIGEKLRVRRRLLGMSQTMLGEALGVTFQQIQKYENGKNSVSPQRLCAIAEILNVPLSYFFEGESENADPAAKDELRASPVAFIGTDQGRSLNFAFVMIRDSRVREKIIALVCALSESPSRSSL